MVVTPSSALALQAPLPMFTLPDTRTDSGFKLGKMVSSTSASSKNLTIIAVICNHCPFVVHIITQLASVLNQGHRAGHHVFAISANDTEHYPQDGPDKMAEFAAANGFEFPYLYDESQAAVKALQAQCTPEFFVFDGHQQLVYRGQFDGARPGSDKPVTGESLSSAIKAALNGEVVSRQHPSMGCNIKWK